MTKSPLVTSATSAHGSRSAALAVRDLGVDYGPVTALRAVSHEVAAGEWLGVIGANGAGKTTLLRALARLTPYRGEVTVNGRDTAKLSARHFAQQVAYVPQKPEFPPEMRAIDYVALGRLPHLGYFGAEGTRDRERCVDLLERLRLTFAIDRTLGTLSGGELQRLVLARALAQGAPVVLLDEPTSALDLGRRVEALELVDELRVERGLTIVSAMHDLTLAAQFCDRLMLLARGEVVSVGGATSVLVEESLNHHFGARVRILHPGENDVVVVPQRRQRKGTP